MLSCIFGRNHSRTGFTPPIEHLPTLEIKEPLQTSRTELDERLADLRELLIDSKLDYYLIPTTDAHASEEVAAADARLSFVSG